MVSVQKQVALTLYYLSDEVRLRKTANTFGLGKSTLSAIIRRVCKVITVRLTSKYIKFPKTKEEVEESSSLFYAKHGFPEQPSENSTDYIKRKGRYTLNIQAVVDHRYCFTGVLIKWPSSVHDSRIFSNSSLNQQFRDGAIPSFEKLLYKMNLLYLFVCSEIPLTLCFHF